MNRKHKKPSLALPEKEHARRLAVYEKGGTIKEIAAELELGYFTVASWINRSGMSAHNHTHKTIEERPPANAYVKTRPAWERKIIRQYASMLERYAEKYRQAHNERPKRDQIWDFTNVWVAQYEGGRI